MLRVAIFDKDYTLVAPVSGGRYVKSFDDQKLLPGVEDGLVQMYEAGWHFAIASNQGGVAAGRKSLAQVIAEMRFCLSLLPVPVNEAFFCPDYAGEECFMVTRDEAHPVIVPISSPPYKICILDGLKDDVIGQCRKPKPGMLLMAKRYAFQSIFVGDRPEDYDAAVAARVPFISAEDWRENPRTWL
jgi:D-glycero-D-manno-heptose 1,7-bisphosphate phosphatase